MLGQNLINPFSLYRSLLWASCYRHTEGPSVGILEAQGSDLAQFVAQTSTLKQSVFLSILCLYLFITLKIDPYDPDFAVRKSSVTAGREEQYPGQEAPLRHSKKKPLTAIECPVQGQENDDQCGTTVSLPIHQLS